MSRTLHSISVTPAAIAGDTRPVRWIRAKLWCMKWIAIAAAWFSSFRKKPLGQPRVAPHAHPHGEVLPFDVRRADPLRVRVALDLPNNATLAHDRAVAPLRFGVGPVDLDELRVVTVHTERVLDRLNVRLEPVSGKAAPAA